MATYIDFTPDEEQALLLAQFLNTILKTKGKETGDSFYEDCTKLVTDSRAELWNKLLDEAPILFSEASEKDVEGFFYSITSLLKRLGPEAVRQTLPRLLKAITSSAEDKSLLRLRILGSIYNILDTHPTVRYEIFNTVMNFASASKHPEIIIPQFRDIERRISEWGIDEKQMRDLYKRIRDLYRQSNKSVDAYKWTVKYVSTLSGTQDEVTTESVNAVLDAIKSVAVYQFDGLLDVTPIKQLEKDSKYSKIYQLLKIFAGETLDAFKSFTNANPGYLKQLGLDEDQLTHKMKLLTLASLAASNHEITYAAIAKALQINADDVEGWVITAISEGLLEAKMNQLKNTVRVTRSIQRVFTRAQWKYLSENLAAWKKNIQILLQTLQDCKYQTQQVASELSRAGDVTQI